ncbi:MAG TPA: kelch repeat-containing protein [Candidatus Thermoplasmatota archaeon]
MRIGPALLLPLLLSACLTSPNDPSRSDQPNDTGLIGTWTVRKDMPIPRTEVTCAAHKETIYVVGGFDATNTATTHFHKYDAGADTWTALASFPVAIHHTGLIARDDGLYAFGGYTGSFPFAGTNTVWHYDPDSNQWNLFTTLPRLRGAHATAALEDHVYLIGGAPQQPGAETYNNVDIYDFKTNTFRTGPSLSATREHLAGAAAAESVVAVGGRRMSLSNFGTTETLAADATSWTKAADMPTPRGGIAAATWNDSVFVFGGEGTQGTFDETESFDVTSGTWSTWPVTPHARHGLCAAALADGIHVIGGGPEPGLSVSAYHEVLSFVES